MQPPLGPDGKPVTPEMLAPVFPMNLIEQEVSPSGGSTSPRRSCRSCASGGPARCTGRAAWRRPWARRPASTTRTRASRPAGSHKPNTAVPQAWYNKQFGIKRLTTETGAGQWGSALAFACALIGLECKVFMVRISFDQKPFRRLMMETWGASCVASPSDGDQGRPRRSSTRIPTRPGSLGIAISEAVEAAVTDPTGKTRYSLGSVLNHVLLHQTIIGLEAKKQLAKAGEKKADVVIGCAGGG